MWAVYRAMGFCQFLLPCGAMATCYRGDIGILDLHTEDWHIPCILIFLRGDLINHSLAYSL